MRFMLFLLALLGSLAPALAYDAGDLARDNAELDRLYLAGDYPAAEAQALATLTAAREAFGPTAIPTLQAETGLANMIRLQGRGYEALEHFRHVHEVAVANYTAYNPFSLRAAMAYAVALEGAGRAEEALPLALEAVRVAEAALGPDDPTTTMWRYNTAGIYQGLGYLPEALVAYERTLAALQASADPGLQREMGFVARTIARTLNEMGDYAKAADGYARALPLVQGFYGPDHPETIVTLTEYAGVLWRAKQRDAMGPVIEAAAAAGERTFGPQSLALAEVLQLRALLLTEGGPGTEGFAQGLAAMEQAIAIKRAELSPTADALGKVLLDYAAMQADVGDLPLALRLAREAEDAGHASRNFQFPLVIEAFEKGALTQRAAGAELLRLAQVANASVAGQAAQTLTRRLLLGDGPAAGLYREATDRVERQLAMQDDLVWLASQPAAERDRDAEGRLRREMDGNLQATFALFDQLEADYPSFADMAGESRLTLDEVQALLTDDQALVIVDIGEAESDRHFVLAVSKTEVGFAESRWTTDSFTSAVADVRAGIALRLGTRAAEALADDAAPAVPDFNFDAAHWLYAETLGLVAPVFAGKSHVMIDARGAFAALPPHLLIAEPEPEPSFGTAQWMIRDHAVSVIPSVFSLRAGQVAADRPAAPAPLLGFADPDYGAADQLASLAPDAGVVLRGALTPLPETADELAAVALALGAGADAQRTGLAATEADLKAETLTDFRVLYFATHGLVSGDVVGASVLGEPALALTPGQGEDGLLTVTEILDLRLNADWVVLSACNTAVGNAPGGQALSGLAQAFFYAGARSMLVSHWPVESRSAARLMQDTFRIRSETPGLPAAEAQRRAMLAMIDAPRNAAWSHPAFWAPFILVGSPD